MNVIYLLTDTYVHVNVYTFAHVHLIEQLAYVHQIIVVEIFISLSFWSFQYHIANKRVFEQVKGVLSTQVQ